MFIFNVNRILFYILAIPSLLLKPELAQVQESSTVKSTSRKRHKAIVKTLVTSSSGNVGDSCASESVADSEEKKLTGPRIMVTVEEETYRELQRKYEVLKKKHEETQTLLVDEQKRNRRLQKTLNTQEGRIKKVEEIHIHIHNSSRPKRQAENSNFEKLSKKCKIVI